MLKSVETNAEGQPLKKLNLEDIKNDLLKLPGSVVVALCIALITEHHRYNWNEIYSQLKTDDFCSLVPVERSSSESSGLNEKVL